MKNKNLNIIVSFWIIVSLVFLIPLNAGVVNADTITDEQAQSTVCGTINVKSSLILSIVTMCIPGILEKLFQYKQIKCRAAQCYYNSVKNGGEGNPSKCIQFAQYETCTYVVGEAFAIPPMSILEYWRSAIANALANPVGLLWGGGVLIARNHIKTNPSCTLTTCMAPVLVVTATDIAGVIQQIKGMLENGFFPSSSTQNSCDGLDEIKKEMEEILKAK